MMASPGAVGDGQGSQRGSATGEHPWDGFLVGPENALAHAGATALARGDGGGVSPLVVHGPAGSGKSRLLAGLVAEWLARRPGSAVSHLTAETFAALCAAAADSAPGWADVRARSREVDLFVLEDLHAIARSPLAMQELGHALDALDARGSAVAVSARAGPGQWEGWPSRVVNRLVGGLSVRLDPPGVALRRRYVLDRARSRSLPLSAGAADALAGAADGFRALDGWLASLALSARLDGRPVDRDSAERLVRGDDGRDGDSVAKAAVESVTRAVAARFGVTPRDLRSAARRRALVGPRHLAIYLSRERTGLSFAALGALFGRRDAATIRHACKAAAARLAADPALAAAVAPLRTGGGGDTRPIE